LDESTTVFNTKFPLESKVLVHTHSPPHVATIVGLPSYTRPDIYTVSFAMGSLAEYSSAETLLEAVPDPTPTSSSSTTLLPFWVQGGANATLFLHNMSKPRHGKLQLASTGEWVFCPGTSTTNDTGIVLSDLSANCQHLIDTGQLFRGHTKFRHVYQMRNQLQTT
jgi:hypothetical protein